MATFMPTNASPSRHRLVLVGALVAALLAVAALAFVLGRDSTHDGATTSGGVVGSGTAAVEHRDVAPFTAVRLDGANEVLVHVGGSQAVVVRADDNLIDRVTTGVEGGALVIGSEGSFSTKTPMSVDVTVPMLDHVTLVGSGHVAVDGVAAASFAASLPGTGTLSVTGVTGTLDARLAGSGELRLEGLVARKATAALVGTGHISVHATRSLDAEVRGTGDIVYTGDPAAVSTHVTGTGAVRPG